MIKKFGTYILAAVVVGVLIIGIRLVRDRNSGYGGLVITYPFRDALFPPEFPPPVFKWEDTLAESGRWKVILKSRRQLVLSDTVVTSYWQPELSAWEEFKEAMADKRISVQVARLDARGESKHPAKISFRFSKDSVGAPILYREIPLPFAYAEENPDSMAYRLINVGSDKAPHTVMKKFMVCGNCHSSSDDGKVIGLDFDAAHRDKGGYFITNIRDTMIFDTCNYLSWSKLQESASFGIFSKISPDGRYVATTLNDKVVAHDFGYDLEHMAFSQLFFPVSGVIGIYDRYTGKIWELQGANSPDFVQSNSFWTPDGENIVFVRTEALEEIGDTDDILVRDEKLINDFIERRRNFKFDIYTVPFNEGKGGEAKPVKGASNNGKSNYFPAVSPDGKWLIFCQSDNFMLLQPDSKLWILPLEGGKPRMLRANLPVFNSWHAWSPNSKWTVFVSKGLSLYTDMFLSHIDERGNSSVPVLLENARKLRRVANYPEFVNIPAEVTFKMVYNYVNIAHIRRAQIAGDEELAQKLYEQYVAQGQYKLTAEYIFLARYNMQKKNYRQAAEFLKMAVKQDPENEEVSLLYWMVVGADSRE